MRFVTYIHETDRGIGLLDAEASAVIPLREAEKAALNQSILPDSMLAFIGMGAKATDTVRAILDAKANLPRIPLDEATLLAPIPRPQKNIFCVGRNYKEHVAERQADPADLPKHPIIFSKAPTTVIGPGATIDPHKDVTEQLDYECELAVIIGKKGYQITGENALDHVFGYTILNDVTARDVQDRHKQWVLGKGMDTFCPMGPFIAHKSLIPDPTQLTLEARVNGEKRQTGKVKDMIFPIPYLIWCLSRALTLEPGDIIATGTPSGVGAGFKPPKFLQSGDVIEMSITKLGTLRNVVG